MRLLLATFLLVTGFSEAASAGERAEEMMESFRSVCMPEPLDFNAVKNRLAALDFKITQDSKTPLQAAGDYVLLVEGKIPLKTGPLSYSIGQTLASGSLFVTCMIADSETRSDDFKAVLMKSPGLGKPLAEHQSVDGAKQSLTWNVPGGEVIVLTIAAGKEQPGISLMVVKQSATQ